MTNEEILRKAIEKAVKNGFDFFKLIEESYGFVTRDPNVVDVFIKVRSKHYYQTIFSHDFAKAFWGEEKVCSNCGHSDSICNSIYEEASFCWICRLVQSKGFKKWQFHLKQMVLKPEPLKYLEKFLEEGFCDSEDCTNCYYGSNGKPGDLPCTTCSHYSNWKEKT